MTAFNSAGVITDPDVLSATVKLTSETRASTSEVFIDTTTTPKSIQLYIDAANSLTTDGVTIKALYSFLKDQWKANADLIKFPFPMTPITDEQFEFTNGWNLDKVTTSGAASQTTPQLLRTGGWAVKNTSGVDTERWVSLISLGTLGSTDQVYYQQVDKLTTDNTTNFVLTGTVNQAVQFYRDDDGDGVTNEGSDFDYSQFMKLFVREWQKTYASSSLTDIGVTTLSYQAYRFPLTNTSDSKIVSLGASEQAASGNVINISTASWSTSVATITTTQGHLLTTGDLVDVKGIVSSGQPTYTYNGTFEIVSTPAYNTFTYAYAAGNPGTYSTGGNVSVDPFNNMSITWYAEPVYETGFQTPSAANYTVVIDADVDGSATTNPSVEEIYAYIQAQLRKTTNINTGNVTQGTSVKIGKVVPEKLRFVGDDLYTLGQSSIYEGVFIRNYSDTDINKLHFTGYGASNVGEVRISSINRSAAGNVTVITTQPHGFESNYAVTVSGITGATTSFNITTGNITVANTTAFYFIQSGTTEAGTTALDSFARFNIPQIISISRSSNTVTAVTLSKHGLAAGNIVTVSGVTAANTSAFNGTWTVASTTYGNTLTYIQTGDNESGTVSSSSKAAPAEFTNIQFPFAAVLTLNFGENLQDDPDAIYRVFFTTSISPAGYDFGTKDAILVNKKGGGTMSGTISSVASVALSYDYDGNTQRGNGSASDAPVTAVAIGLSTAQYVTATGTIARSVTNSISLVAPLERNYQP